MRDTNSSVVQLNIATCPVNWNNNDLDNWRTITPFPAILDQMLEAGYAATEYDASFGDEADAVIKEIESRGVTLTGSYTWVDFLAAGGLSDSYEYLRPTLQFLSEIGCHNLIVSDPLRSHRVALAGRIPADGSESLGEGEYQRIADGIHALAGIADEYGICVRYHNHVGSWIEAPGEVDALLRYLDTSCADLCFDTGHYAYGGGNPADFIQANVHRIGYLHLKDVDAAAVEGARNRGLTFLEALRDIVFAPIGTGTAGISSILSVLVSNHFRGWIVVEQDTCAGDPTAAARANLEFIEQWLDQHGSTGR